MATPEVLVNANRILKTSLIVEQMSTPRKTELGVPEAVTGERPKEMDHFLLESGHSRGNVGPSFVTDDQVIHPRQLISVYAALKNTAQRNKNNQSKTRLSCLFSERSFSKRFSRRSSITSTSYITSSEANENKLPPRPRTSTGRFIACKTTPMEWVPPHAGIFATGQALLPESYINRPLYRSNSTSRDSVWSGTYLPHHTSMNYVPPCDHWTRGDSGIIQITPPENEVPQMVKDDSSVFAKELAKRTPASTGERRPQSVLKTSRTESPDWPNGKRPRSEKKRVRFSASPLSNKMEEPAYVEGLLNKISKRLQHGVKQGRVASNEEEATEEVTEEEATKEDATELKATARTTATETESSTEEEDHTNKARVSPTTKITVTRPKRNEEEMQTAAVEGTGAGTSETQKRLATNLTGQEVDLQSLEVVTNATNNSKTDTANEDKKKELSGNDITTRTTYGRENGAEIEGKEKTVPKLKYAKTKQIIASASPRDRSKTERKVFTLQATRLTRNESPRVVLQKAKGYTASAKQTADDSNGSRNSSSSSYQHTALHSGQTSVHQGQCLSIDSTINNTNSKCTSAPTESPRPIRASLLPADASYFQRIPSMPDHINFCSTRKTEAILQWLDDVNKKRKSGRKFKKGSSLMSSRTVLQKI